jgi:hypothetical protein
LWSRHQYFFTRGQMKYFTAIISKRPKVPCKNGISYFFFKTSATSAENLSGIFNPFRFTLRKITHKNLLFSLQKKYVSYLSQSSLGCHIV